MTTRREFIGAAAMAGSAAPARQPNLLFFFPDQQWFDWTSLNRALPLRTANLDALHVRGESSSRMRP